MPASPNRSLVIAGVLFFRREDFVWLLMSDSELLRIKPKSVIRFQILLVFVSSRLRQLR